MGPAMASISVQARFAENNVTPKTVWYTIPMPTATSCEVQQFLSIQQELPRDQGPWVVCDADLQMLAPGEKVSDIFKLT